jgi:hypothetical protein
MDRLLSILITAHSHWRHMVMLVGVIALVALVIGLLTGRWRSWHKGLCIATIIVVDLQVLMGLSLWLLERRWLGNDALRSWEHPVTMLLAAAAIHVGWARAKEIRLDGPKLRTALIGLVVAAVLVAIGLTRILAR